MAHIAYAHSSVIQGISAIPVCAEVSVRAADENSFVIVGLADTAVRESSHRVLSALRTLGYKISGNVLINLSPAEVKKEGSAFDLPIAVALLANLGVIPAEKIKSYSFYGEVGLDGTVRPVKGLIAHLILALETGRKFVVLPKENASVAALFPKLNILFAENLPQLITALHSDNPLPFATIPLQSDYIRQSEDAINEVCGQLQAKRAILIAAAGGHNLLMLGPPGCGKSMLAERMNSILPPLSEQERLESARIYSVLGENIEKLLCGARPFRAPHYVVSDVGLIGGGHPLKPGEISLAHNGVLFLDEFPEYRRSALESLRVPMESCRISIVRSRERVIFPAKFQLIAAMNPCPCGKLGVKGESCSCSPSAVHRYLGKISRPILDRIDLQVSLQAVKTEEIKNFKRDNFNYANAVERARNFASQRSFLAPARYSNQETLKYVSLSNKCEVLLEDFCRRNCISLRGYFRILKIARTIADLEESQLVAEAHLMEACSYRSLSVLSEYIRQS